MINDLSSTLKEILDDSSLPDPLLSAGIEFAPPVQGYNPSKDTVNLFLYDIRENVELHSNEPTLQRQNGQVIIQPPPLRVACSYLITAWPGGSPIGEVPALKEHQLLSQVLQKLSLYPTIPAQFLQGSLTNQEPPMPMVTARADGMENPAEFWTSLENRLRPSLKVTVTISMDIFEAKESPMVIASDTRLGERTTPVEEQILPVTLQHFFRIGGTITDAGDDPVAGAEVTLVEQGLVTETNTAGQYAIGLIPSGNYTLRVESGPIVRTKNITIPPLPGSDYNVQLT
jgi:hypothetical protein